MLIYCLTLASVGFITTQHTHSDLTFGARNIFWIFAYAFRPGNNLSAARTIIKFLSVCNFKIYLSHIVLHQKLPRYDFFEVYSLKILFTRLVHTSYFNLLLFDRCLKVVLGTCETERSMLTFSKLIKRLCCIVITAYLA